MVNTVEKNIKSILQDRDKRTGVREAEGTKSQGKEAGFTYLGQH